MVCRSGDGAFDTYCPVRLRMVIESLNAGPRHVRAKSDVAPRSYDAIEKSFRSWCSTLTELAAKHDDDAMRYSLYGLRKRACVELAEADCLDVEIRTVTGQSRETVAKYRKEANQKAMSRTAKL